MFYLFLLFCVILMFVYLSNISSKVHGVLDTIGSIGAFASGFVCLVLLIIFLATGTASWNITVYEQYNQDIYNEISSVVYGYMEYEQETFNNLNVESPVVLVNLYPELKTDSLVAAQLETYTNNQREIKELQSKTILHQYTRKLLFLF